MYDGHGGMDASSYTAAHLNTVVADCLCQKNNIQQALTDGFEKTDKEFGNKSKQEVCHKLDENNHTVTISWY